MPSVPLSSDEDRLLVDLANLYHAWSEASRRLHGGRYRWRTINGTDYLLKYGHGQNSGVSQGPRTPEREALFEQGAQDEALVRNTWNRLRVKGRMLKAARVPMITEVAGKALRALDTAGLLGDHLRVVGSTAIPAYEIAASVKFDPDLHATEDVDVAWVGPALPTEETGARSPLLEAMQRADKSWTVNQERTFQLRNRHGDVLDVLVPPSAAGTLPRQEAVQAIPTVGQEDLLGGKPLDIVVLDAAGLPARVVAPDPRLFALHKILLSQDPERRAAKRSKDARQAEMVWRWVREYLLEYPVDKRFQASLSPRLKGALVEIKRRTTQDVAKKGAPKPGR